MSAGKAMTGVGVLKLVVGALVYRATLLDLLRRGLWGTVDDASGSPAAALWFLVAGGAFVLLGIAMRALERRGDDGLPLSLGVGLVSIALFAIVLMPASGAWLVLAIGLWVCVLAARRQGRLVEQVRTDPRLRTWLAGADVLEVEVADGPVSLEQLAAGMLNFRPAWLQALFAVRMLLVRVLGIQSRVPPPPPTFSAASLPTTPGARVGPFQVGLAEEDEVWSGEVEESHLRATLTIRRPERPSGEQRRYFVITAVHYKHWTGRLYYNIIWPFHLVVIKSMIRHGLRGTPGEAIPT